MKNRGQLVSALIFLLIAGAALITISRMRGEKNPLDNAFSAK